jgi:putative membrane protein
MRLNALIALAGLVLTAAPAFAGPGDVDFIRKAVAGNEAEVQMGSILQTRGHSDALKRFGSVLVSDHTLALAQARSAAHAMGVRVSSHTSAEAAQQMKQLWAATDSLFDSEARRIAIEDHQKDIALYEAEASKGSGPAADYARQTLPVLQRHLQMAEALPGL